MLDIYWLLRVCLRTIEHGDRTGSLFAFMPEFYLSVAINSYSALKNYFGPVHSMEELPGDGAIRDLGSGGCAERDLQTEFGKPRFIVMTRPRTHQTFVLNECLQASQGQSPGGPLALSFVGVADGCSGTGHRVAAR